MVTRGRSRRSAGAVGPHHGGGPRRAPEQFQPSGDVFIAGRCSVGRALPRPRRSTASTRFSSPTRRAPPGAPRARSTCTAAFSPRSPKRSRSSSTSGPDDRLFWFADMGWIMGPWEVVGTLALGATLAMYEGAPDYPRARSAVGLPRAPSGHDPRHQPHAHSLADGARRRARCGRTICQALRILGSTGEPWNDDPWRWYFEVVGEKRCPVINISGGTEVGACFLSPHPVEPIKPMSLGGPALGMAVDVFDDEGKPLRGAGRRAGVQEAVAGHDARPLQGRAALPRDVLRVAGPTCGCTAIGRRSTKTATGFCTAAATTPSRSPARRLGPAEVESALVSHAAVVEAAAIGVPDELKGEALWAFVVLSAARHGERSAARRAGRVGRRPTGVFVPPLVGCASRRRSPRHAAPRSCAARSEPRRSANRRAISRHSRIRRRSTPFATPPDRRQIRRRCACQGSRGAPVAR